MRKTSLRFLLTIMFITGSYYFSVGSAADAITPDLAHQMNVVAEEEMIRINITLTERFDSQSLIAGVQTMDKAERRKHVMQVLQDFTALSQQGVIAELNSLQQSKSVENVKTFWITNVINCYATPSAIELLSYRSDIASIDYDEFRQVIDPSENKNAYAVQGIPASKEIVWNVLKINADDVWALGFTGEGVIVSVIDTGVNYDHLDLEDHMWESVDYPNHGWDFFYNDDDPKDEHGHGTHVAGTVAGDGTAGSETGMAPDATIMACKVGDALGNSSESMVWSAVEFSIEQGADVISLSMGWLHAWGPNRTAWRESFDAALAAGVVASVAAGNEGTQLGSYPIPDNVRSPGDCPPPWLNPDQTLTGGVSGVICVGSTTSSDAVSSFSGRGPSTWEAISPFFDYPYQPEIGLIRPDIAAPGSDIKSLAHYNNTGYEAGWSGTSMATPANSGMIALMIQKNNTLTPENISQIVEETALVLAAGKNNNSGSGRIDALAAVNATPFPGPTYYSHTLNDEAGNNDGLMNPGESILLTVAIANFSDEVVTDVTVVLSTESEYITITDDTEYFGDFSLEDIIEIEDAFAFDVAENIPGGEIVQFILTASNAEESWESSFTEMAHAVNLMMAGYTIEDPTGNNNGNLDPGETADILVETTNNGQLDATATMAYLNALNSLVTVNSGSFDLGTIEAGQSAVATFNITVSDVAPIGTSVEFLFEATSGFFTLETSLFAKIGVIIEDFETGDFTMFEWEFAGNQDWEITDEAYEGQWAAKSGEIGDNQNSEIKLTYEVGGNDSIAFYRKVSSEGSYDYLEFYIDNEVIDQWAGEIPWERVAYPVTGGEHTFRWVYDKDQSVSTGLDRAWIDNIELPAGIDLTLSAYAGEDEEICEDSDFETNGFAQNYGATLWLTSGTGDFEDENELITIYMPSELDYASGAVTLSLTAFATGQEPVIDEMELSFAPLPEAAGPITGEIEVCNGTSEDYQVDSIANSDIYHWELNPEEAGTINGDVSMITIDWADDYVGEALLKVQGMNDCGDGDYSDELVIMVDECSGFGEISQREFTISPNPSNGTFTLTLEKELKSGTTIRMINLTGTMVFEQKDVRSNNLTLQAEDVENGVYFLIIESGDSQMIEKVVIQK